MDCGQPNLKRQKREKKKKLKSAKLANQILTDSQFHIKKKKKKDAEFHTFIYKFHSILYNLFIQSFSEIKRERVREKNLEGGRTAGGGGSNEADD